MALVPLNDTITQPGPGTALLTVTGAASILDTAGAPADIWGDQAGTIPATNPVPVVDGRYPSGLWIEEDRYTRVIGGDAQPFEAARAVPGGAVTQEQFQSAGTSRVFLQPTAPAGVTGNYLWIETQIGVGNDFTFWIEDGV